MQIWHFAHSMFSVRRTSVINSNSLMSLQLYGQSADNMMEGKEPLVFWFFEKGRLVFLEKKTDRICFLAILVEKGNSAMTFSRNDIIGE